MARLESILFTPHVNQIDSGRVEWRPHPHARKIADLPQIFWSDGTPWNEVNLWFYERAIGTCTSIRTVEANALALYSYAQWLEINKTSWQHFPVRKADRCLVRFRGELIEARNNGVLAPSTVSQRMHSVVNFYRWLNERNLFQSEWPMWSEQKVKIPISSSAGFERTITVNTTDLKIPNRKVVGERLEDGLTPLAKEDRDILLRFARTNCSQELFLMLTLGFFTGMRVGTLCDLKVRTVANAIQDPSSSNLLRIAVGPGAMPSVATKFGVTGQVLLTRQHHQELMAYCHSVHRLKRERLANAENKDLVFLTRYGNPYARRGSDRSPAINVEMYRLRQLAFQAGLSVLHKFHFHQSRCTFATELAQIAVSSGNPEGAVALVKEALLHRDEQTSLKYVRFVKTSRVKRELTDIFTQAFLGVGE
ncbi:tyrosine-type recombinase/integrase [Herbaspirillum rubrisubalbicans]|uniref:tyrosine-type recombinase/integrase n=1 Tax=Herbaspirillum rubrisubalbicans TaxID=80842 RepID=UPI000DD3AF89|nr:site-specific integrase [Herbaspirillum rubrisubalbicans]